MSPLARSRKSARIAIGSQLFSAPADSPYDRQLLFELAGHLARRKPAIRVQIDRAVLTVTGVGKESCNVCSGAGKLALSQGPRLLCPACASKLFEREERKSRA